MQGSVYIENGSSQTPAVNTPVTFNRPAGGSWMSGGQSTTSVVYSVYTSNQGTFSVDWIAPSIPGLYTLSASADMATSKLPITVNAVGTISYSGNGAKGGTVPVDSNSYTAGASATVLGNSGNLVKTGYTFAGWDTAADGIPVAHQNCLLW